MRFQGRYGRVAVIVFLCIFVRPLGCFADKVFLKSGQEEEGRIVEKNRDYIVLYVNGALKVHPAFDIVKIVKAPLPNSIPKKMEAGQAGVEGQKNNVCASTDTCCMLGTIALSKRESDSAIKFFDDAIRYDPKNAKAYVGRGQAHMIKGEKGKEQKTDYSEALKNASEAVKLAPSSVPGLLLRANALRKLGRPDEAIVDCEKAMAIMPLLPGPYKERGAAYCVKGNYDSAISDASKAIALSDGYKPYLTMVFIQRAEFYLKKGDIARAEVDCDRASQFVAGSADAFEVRAKIFAARKEYDRAWAEVRKVQESGVPVSPVFLEELKKNSPPS